jgi:hypothetical protein
MSTARRIPLVFGIVLGLHALVALRPASAHADDNLLRGPHPFLKENAISAYVLVASGQGDSMGGGKVVFDYGYKLTGGPMPAWLDLAVGIQHATCSSDTATSPCGLKTGSTFETLAGVKWKFATAIPLVPFVGAGAGFAFGFPNGANAGMGIMARAVGGATYFLVDWLGLGLQVGYSLGYLGYDSTFTGSSSYAVFDLGGGVELQF